MREINGKTETLGVIGNPIEHTLSPVIHNTLCELLGINAVYVPIHVEQDIDTAIKGLYASGIKRLNVTVPYKKDVMNSLVEIDELAEEIGAVNTLVPFAGGFKGYNTDMPGLKRALESKGVKLEGKKAILIGAGGAARAVCLMLIKSGVSSIYILNRSIEKAQEIVENLGTKYTNTSLCALSLGDYKNIPEDKYIMFQCTSVGLKPEDKLLINDDAFYGMAEYGYDLIYNPAVTPFISKLSSLGIKNDNGLTMLLYQGIIAYEMWFGVKVTHKIADIVYSELCKKLYGGNIVLIGYMGSGKTSVGKALAKKKGMKYIDLDEYIVQKEGRSINDIFETEREEYFRNLESECIRELSLISNTVVATGGGAVIRKENRDNLGKLGTVVYLKADTDTIVARVKGDESRPLLKSESEEELRKKVSSMLDKRGPYYEMFADQVIYTDRLTPDEIAEIFD
ncbi:shikimate dehydrogenase /shikimate kinase [Lachnospiraceae bacterium NE2001]|nr:shikimate dehydrogenase /shikimate kinase [Lachnospiraceae bacterium NE2001]